MTVANRSADLSKAHVRAHQRRARSDKAWMTAMFAISYPLCLTAAVTGRVFEVFGSRQSGVPRESVFAEAKSAACAAVGFAFHA